MNDIDENTKFLLLEMQKLVVAHRATQEILAIAISKIAKESSDPEAWLKGLEKEIAQRRTEALSRPEVRTEHKDFGADVLEQVDRFFAQYRS